MAGLGDIGPALSMVPPAAPEPTVPTQQLAPLEMPQLPDQFGTEAMTPGWKPAGWVDYKDRSPRLQLLISQQAAQDDTGKGFDYLAAQMKQSEERTQLLNQRFQETMQQLQAPLPQPTPAQMDMGHLLALGLGLALGGGHNLPTQINQGMAQAHQDAQLKDQYNLQNFQIKRQNLEKVLQYVQAQLADENNFRQNAGIHQADQQMQNAREDRLNARQDAQNLYNRWSHANTRAEADDAGTKLLKQGIITQQQYKDQIEAAGRQEKKADFGMFFDTQQKYVNAYGHVPSEQELPGVMSELSAMRDELAKKYPGTPIPPIMTADTIAKQKFDEAKAQHDLAQKRWQMAFDWRKAEDIKRDGFTVQRLQDSSQRLQLAKDTFERTGNMDSLRVWQAEYAPMKGIKQKLASQIGAEQVHLQSLDARIQSLQNQNIAQKTVNWFTKDKTGVNALQKALTDRDALRAKIDAMQSAYEGLPEPPAMPENVTQYAPQSPAPLSGKMPPALSGAIGGGGNIPVRPNIPGVTDQPGPNEAFLRKQAMEAIAKGADRKKVAERFKKLTGKDL